MDSWDVIDEMVSQLGSLYALEVEAEAFPEIGEEPPLRAVRLAVLRAAAEMSRLTSLARPGNDPGLAAAREALHSARAAAESARALIREARAARNREV